MYKYNLSSIMQCSQSLCCTICNFQSIILMNLQNCSCLTLTTKAYNLPAIHTQVNEVDTLIEVTTNRVEGLSLGLHGQ